MKEQAREIQKAIHLYAHAYGILQSLQEESPLIPKGDQKTGCIGEFYAYLFLHDRFPEATVKYGGHSQKGWDIELRFPDERVLRVQVKTVSEYSTSRGISPIHAGWDMLCFVYLDCDFKPQGFWIVDDPSIVSEGVTLTGKRCPQPGVARTGSRAIPFGANRIKDLKQSIRSYCAE